MCLWSRLQWNSCNSLDGSYLQFQWRGNRGTCLHNISFNFEDFALGVTVKITKGFWNGAVGPIRYRSPSGEFGIELTTADYGKVIVWVGKDGIKRYVC